VLAINGSAGALAFLVLGKLIDAVNRSAVIITNAFHLQNLHKIHGCIIATQAARMPTVVLMYMGGRWLPLGSAGLER
jgi:hypothetical protein